MSLIYPKKKLKDLNMHIKCVLCGGYYIDATTIIECLHSFCKTCIVRYLETHKFCPICDVQIHKTRPLINIRSDQTLQDIVYKLVPDLFKGEMKRRRDYFAQHPEALSNGAIPTCSEGRGEVLGGERLIFTREDFINISLESCPPPSMIHVQANFLMNSGDMNGRNRRYFRCPGGLTVAHLKKLLRSKHALQANCHVDIFYIHDLLDESYTMIDLAYIYSWRRNGDLRLLYRTGDEPLLKKQKLVDSTPTAKNVTSSINETAKKPIEEPIIVEIEREKISECDKPTLPTPISTPLVPLLNPPTLVSTLLPPPTHATPTPPPPNPLVTEPPSKLAAILNTPQNGVEIKNNTQENGATHLYPPKIPPVIPKSPVKNGRPTVPFPSPQQHAQFPVNIAPNYRVTPSSQVPVQELKKNARGRKPTRGRPSKQFLLQQRSYPQQPTQTAQQIQQQQNQYQLMQQNFQMQHAALLQRQIYAQYPKHIMAPPTLQHAQQQHAQQQAQLTLLNQQRNLNEAHFRFQAAERLRKSPTPLCLNNNTVGGGGDKAATTAPPISRVANYLAKWLPDCEPSSPEPYDVANSPLLVDRKKEGGEEFVVEIPAHNQPTVS